MSEIKEVDKIKCGIIMPISSLIVDGVEYSEVYWQSVLDYLKDAIRDAGYEPVVAWESDKSNLIHAKIVRNIQELPIMVGVLVGNNANVWLECGMRLWSQKPIVLLISDRSERPPFDISPIACLKFPVDNLYTKMKKLKEELKTSLDQAMDPSRKSILSHFGAIESTVTTQIVSKVDLDKFMTDTKDELSSLRGQVRVLTAATRGRRDGMPSDVPSRRMSSLHPFDPYRQLGFDGRTRQGFMRGPTGPSLPIPDHGEN